MQKLESTRIRKIIRWGILVLILAAVLFRAVSCIVTYTTADFVNGKLIVDGHAYIQTGVTFSGKTRKISHIEEWGIYQIKEDPSRTFLYISSFLDGYSFVREDYVIPTEGEITVLYFENHRITDPGFIRMIEELSIALPEETFTVRYDEMLPSKCVRVGYEGCPVGTHLGGYFALINGKFVLLTDPNPNYKEGAEFDTKDYVCYVLSEKHAKVLEPLRDFFSEINLPEV